MGRVHGSEVIDLDEARSLVASGHLSEQRHAELGYRILNYTSRTVIEHRWTTTTERCRGLVLDAEEYVVARPLRKFHNFTQVRPPGFVLTKPSLMYEKVDGSLGIVVPSPGGHIISTRGSFVSPQAIHATDLWQRDYADKTTVPPGVTLLVEIIHPVNKIVVDYGDRNELVLLAAIDNRTGADVPLWEIDWPGARAELFASRSIDEAYSFATGNKFAHQEGLVLVWMRLGEESYRLKVKHPDYVRRHALIYGLSTVSIWRQLSAGQGVEDLVAELPDEVHDWTRATAHRLHAAYAAAVATAEAAVATVPRGINRADQARLIKKMHYPPLVFMLLDDRDINPLVWQQIRPIYEPFRGAPADAGSDN
jgi:RNA ligase